MRDKVLERIDSGLTYNFNDSEIELLRRCSRDMYKCLRSVFSRPRIERPISSVQSYRLSLERRMLYPERFYSFVDHNVSISIIRNSEGLYKVMVSGYKLDSSLLQAIKIVGSDEADVPSSFRSGFYFYGSFVRSNFSQCLYLFKRIIICYLFDSLGLNYKRIYKQTEFIW